MKIFISFMVLMGALVLLVWIASYETSGGRYTSQKTPTIRPISVITPEPTPGPRIIKGSVSNAINLGLYPVEIRYAEINYRGYGTPIDKRTEREYHSADKDGDGWLSPIEIVDFVTKWNNLFRYTHNVWALTPTEFHKSKAGDCEDIAIFIADFFNYWTVPAYVGGIESKLGGHAIVLMGVHEAVDGFINFYVAPGTYVEEGYYIPIDYDVIGGFSDAVGENWYMGDVWTTGNIYGLRL